MADCLSVLRQYVSAGRVSEIREVEDHIIIGDFGWTKTARTNYLVYGKGRESDRPAEYYTLAALVFLIRHVDIPHAQYVRQAGAANVQPVSLPDRRGLLEYLKGNSESAESVDKSAPLEMPVQPSVLQRLLKQAATVAAAAPHEKGSVVPSLDGFVDESGRKRVRHEEGEDAARERERWMAARLDTSSATKGGEDLLAAGSRLQDQIKESGLAQRMSLTKITALRAKRWATKRINIKGDDEDDIAGIVGTGGGGGGAAGRPSGGYLALDQDLTRAILQNERVWRTRTSVLLAPSMSKDFWTNISGILSSVKARQSAGPGGVKEDQHGRRHINGTGAGAGGHGASAAASAASRKSLPPSSQSQAASSQASAQQQQAYSRYEQERFIRPQAMTDHGFEIDTAGTYRGKNLKLVAGPETEKQKAGGGGGGMTPGRHGKEVEQVAGTPNKQLSPRSQMAARAGNPANQVLSNPKRVSRTPIIIIPSATTSLITVFNAKELLQDLRYVPSDEKRQALLRTGKAPENEVLIQRKKAIGEPGGPSRPPGGGATTSVPYRVVDSIQRLAPQDWDRVVAVFAQGPAWQFKGWPWAGSPVDIFANICAFHICWSEIPIDKNIKGWTVTVLQLDKLKRHLDRAVLMEFWHNLDRHMMKSKSHLRW